jgi:uncharacterized membrane protein
MTDEKLQSMIGNLLRAGVLAAAFIVGASGVLYLTQHHAEPVRYATFQVEKPDLRTLNGIFRSSLQMKSDGLIQLGLLLLIATPIARVALAAAGFYLEHDWLYVGVSAIVLAILVFSLLHSS